MVFSRLSELFSSAATRFSRPKPSTLPNKSSGLPPIPTSSPHGYPLSGPKQSHMRLSSSLQDLSTYNLLNAEQGNPSSGPVPPFILQKEHALSSFSKEKVPLPGTSSRRKKCVRIFCVLLGLLLIACFSVALRFLYSNWSRGFSKFYVVLDCGSTGTRVYVYQASVNHNKDYNLPILLKSLPEDFQMKTHSQSGRAYSRMETEPGFDKLVRNISGLRRAINPLIQWAQKQIPSESHTTTSLFLYATAGVRRLPNPDSEWLLDNAYLILKNSPFLCKKEWIKIISGMEEAYYGWIALNYHNEILGSIPKRETYGALDLGGSSLQVTFEGTQSGHDETSLKLSIGPVNHNLSAYSLAGYGLNDAFDKSVAHLLKSLPGISNADLASGKVKINHPCLLSGYEEQYTCSHCSSTQLQDGSSPIGVRDSRKGGKVGVPVQLFGAPNWEKCSVLSISTVNSSEWSSDHRTGIDCEVHPCALPENLPRPTGPFFAMSGFYVVYRFFNLPPDAALDEVLDKGRAFCNKEWGVARKSVAPQPFIEQYCFRAPYVVFLLRKGLHIQDTQVTIGSGSITWTLGVALFEAGKVYPYGAHFPGYDIFREKINPFVLFAILFTSLVVLLCALSYVGKGRFPQFMRRSYLPVFMHNSVASGSGLNFPAPFRFQRWSPISTGDGRAKLPLSPTVASGQSNPFDGGPGFDGGSIQFTNSSLYSPPSGVAHSYSSGNLGQIQFDNSTLASFWIPNRRQMQLQSRRSQSREDLNSSLVEAHLIKI